MSCRIASDDLHTLLSSASAQLPKQAFSGATQEPVAASNQQPSPSSSDASADSSFHARTPAAVQPLHPKQPSAACVRLLRAAGAAPAHRQPTSGTPQPPPGLPTAAASPMPMRIPPRSNSPTSPPSAFHAAAVPSPTDRWERMPLPPGLSGVHYGSPPRVPHSPPVPLVNPHHRHRTPRQPCAVCPGSTARGSPRGHRMLPPVQAPQPYKRQLVWTHGGEMRGIVPQLRSVVPHRPQPFNQNLAGNRGRHRPLGIEQHIRNELRRLYH